MAQLYTLGEILAATGGVAEGVSGDSVCSLSIDSRELAPEALFVAIKGDRFDGHDFVADALRNGAVAALVSREKAANLGDRLIIVPDALEALSDLARAARARSNAKVVAVTGSAGKTTTKEAIRTVFEAAGRTHASIKSFNNHWGVPLMLARMPADTEFGVFEIGMNHAGEITPLTKLVRPHVAVITTVAAAHLEFFPSVEAIALAKAEIFAGIEPGGVAVLNADHPYIGILRDAAADAGVARVVTYGFAPDADWRIDTMTTASGIMSLSCRHHARRFELQLRIEGRHMAANAVAALAVAELCGIAPEVAMKALAGFGAPEGRGLALRLGPAENPLLLIDESYNANSASMAAALEVFAGQIVPGGKKILVLGDMLELGAQGPALHRALKQAVVNTGADKVFLVGSGMAVLAEALGPGAVAAHALSVDAVAESIVNGLAYGDTIMVKGSNGVRLGGLVKQIRERFQ
ncbi:MAG TPA: UDP-N-acetylmuramoyl-tripeptide--D-alanyl-D-alanine ligase [Arsenicitalea sp.]|jgi:UDP-N-acetylmuramoyl-tripeptide--D-alanyl-D-alanine ligase|nr:UDP-N-acetylmuramoyl-tripeptide--D-alanyl-D-alanine ligase [Arsenicitalea sp.]